MWISRYVTLQDTSLVKKKKKKELNCGALGSNDMERAGAEAAGRFEQRQGSAEGWHGHQGRTFRCRPETQKSHTHPVQVKPKAAR